MCSCAVALPTLSPTQQYMKPVLERGYRTDSDLHALQRDIADRHLSSAPPSLGVPCTPPPSGSNSSWSNRPRHYDVAVRVMLKKHECQFKLPQGELQTHLRAIFHHLRPQDNIKLAVRLESWVEDHRRYLVIISTTGRQDTEESIIVGCDFATKESTTCTIGLVLPIWCDTSIRLDGDGGFHVECHERIHTFKPVSVQAMWSALQSLHRCADVAQRNNYYEGSLYLTWTCFYASRVKSDRVHVNEWQFRENLWARKDYFENTHPERVPVESLIRSKLKEVMMKMDLDNCTCKQIRFALEEVIDMDLRDYKEYIDTEMLTVLGQMDCSSKILDYLYLGSEWNACNLEELEALGITHILNVTIEVDNFFPEDFRYKSVRLFDVEASDLLPHWNYTGKFITEARKAGGKVLVHCKMGISRSAATVCAYLMKENQWTKNRALDYVKSCRSIIDPNPAFRRQLDEYQGIVFASAQRHNKLFRSRSESSLSEPSINDDQHPAMTSPRTPVIQLPDDNANVAMETEDFDLNRHLLDIATLSVPKVSRPKSWSPDEGRTCYNPNKNPHNEQFNMQNTLNVGATNENFRLQHTSEPGDLLAPTAGDVDRNLKVKELRKNFADKRAHMRRHTEAAAPRGGDAMQLDELAQSEDSVFVHDGSGPIHHDVSRVGREYKIKKHNISKRSSSPAALLCDPVDRPDTLDVEGIPQHTSMTSPMHSPSYKNAKNVDIGLLKSRFSDPDIPDDVTTPDETADVTEQTTTIKASVPVREIIAVIESPTDDAAKLIKLASSGNLQSLDVPADDKFTKGHYKTVSLPPGELNSSSIPVPPQVEESCGDSQSRGRSYSETQVFSVKKIVTAIESKYSPDVGSDSGEGIHRTMSMPSGRRKATSPSVTPFVPVTEAACEKDNNVVSDQPESQSCFFIGDTDNDKSSITDSVMTWCGANNSNSNNNNNITMTSHSNQRLSPVATVDVREFPLYEEEEQRSCHLSPEQLHVIREVGMQLMSDSDDGSFSSPASRHSDVIQPSDVTPQGSSNAKKRGLVRQMAREIEKRVRKLTGRSPKVEQGRPKALKTSEPLPMKRLSSPTTVINKLLMGESTLQSSEERCSSLPRPFNQSPVASPGSRFDQSVVESPDVRVRELVDKFDSSAEPSPSTSPTKKLYDLNFRGSPPHIVSARDGAKDLTSLVTAVPYRSPDGSRVSPPGVSKFKLSVKPRVRRSHSERVGVRTQTSKRTGYFRSFRTTDSKLTPVTRSSKSQPELTEAHRGEGSPLFLSAEYPNMKGKSPTLTNVVSPISGGDGADLSGGERNSSPRPVRDIVRTIEMDSSKRSSSVHRSSSMPSTPPSRIPLKENPSVKSLRKTLTRSRSTPLLGKVRPSQLRKSVKSFILDAEKKVGNLP